MATAAARGRPFAGLGGPGAVGTLDGWLLAGDRCLEVGREGAEEEKGPVRSHPPRESSLLTTH